MDYGSASFDGIFDGNDFIISNLKIKGGNYLGLFGVLGRNAIVENLSIEDANIVGGCDATNLGMLAAENWGSISDCQITGSVFGEQCGEQVERIVGYNYGTISNCEPIDYSGPYSVIITDPEATQGFLMFNGINFDEVWIPEETDIEDISSVLKEHLESDEPDVDSWACEYILENISLYDREYSGFVLDDSKYIICQMVFFTIFWDPCNPEDEELPDSFSIIFDGGCAVVTVVFDVENKTVVSIVCNGEA